MSKPDPAGGSLESILASIRKSLTEQSTDALSELAAPMDQDKDPRPRRGLTQRLAGTTAEASNGDAAGVDDLSDLLEVPPAQAVPALQSASASEAARPVAAPAAAGEQDPLWFLTRRDEPAPDTASPPLPGATEPQPATATAAATTAAAAQPPAEPKLTRPEVLRASMPPFFGSSAEAATSPPPPPEPAVQASNAPQVARVQASPDAAMAREVSLLAVAAEAAATRPPQTAPQSGLNGKSPPGPAAATDAPLAGDTAHNRALEVMVLDLLKPMLSQWLEQNMPRLVADALSEEVQRARAAKGDAKKT